jgi:hypothetical protein
VRLGMSRRRGRRPCARHKARGLVDRAQAARRGIKRHCRSPIFALAGLVAEPPMPESAGWQG